MSEGLGPLDVHNMQTNIAKEAILDRVKNLEEAIAKGHAYLESGDIPIGMDSGLTSPPRRGMVRYYRLTKIG